MDKGATNLRKMRTEWDMVKLFMRPHLKRFSDEKSFHTAQNIVTEAFRLSPYLFAHVVVFACIINTIAWGVVIYFLVRQ